MTKTVDDSGGTVSERKPRELVASARLTLQLALCGERPTLGGHTFDLTGVDALTIGRGGALALMPATTAGAAHAEVPDPTVSRQHVRLTLGDGFRCTLEDLGSRNGTRLRGEPVRRAEVGDGDWFVIGRSVFVLAAEATPGAPGPFSVGPSGLLRTFVPELARTYETAARLASSTVPLLVLAETGTGKEVLAREIHALSGRRGPLVAINCAALPETLVESELFGYRRGAFSEARDDRPGLIRSADGGTLLLDEIGDLPIGSQAKLLRVLQEGEVLSLGATRPVHVDVRVVAATQQRLDQAVRDGRFRPDLLGRLAGYALTLPPLRDRLADLGLLVGSLLARHAGPDAPSYRLTSDACIALCRRRWSLNVRELEQALQAAIVLAAQTREIDVHHLGDAVLEGAPADAAGREELKARLLDSLQRHAGNVTAVARELGKARMQVHRWMQQFGVDAARYRPSGDKRG